MRDAIKGGKKREDFLIAKATGNSAPKKLGRPKKKRVAETTLVSSSTCPCRIQGHIPKGQKIEPTETQAIRRGALLAGCHSSVQ
jgi:hypothetical protein